MKKKKAGKQNEAAHGGKEDEKEAFDDHEPTAIEHIVPEQHRQFTRSGKSFILEVQRNRDNRGNNEHETLHIPIAKTIIQPLWTHSFHSLDSVEYT